MLFVRYGEVKWEAKMDVIMDVIAHYDLLVDENNDPFYDSPELKDYMNKWDRQVLNFRNRIGNRSNSCQGCPLL